LILKDYSNYYIKLKLEALDLILENQIASRPVVLDFIKDLQSSDKTSEAEKEIINSRFQKFFNSK
jgi:molybdate-binding protein